MNTHALDELVHALHLEFEAGAAGSVGGRITRLLGDYARSHDDWRAFAFFSDECYTRNLVAREERFELMVLCWGVGQESLIHNHEGQLCWMGVLEGRMEEQRFAMPEPGTSGPLPMRESLHFDAPQVAFIRDEMGLHLVRPALEAGPGVTLHLYSAPYDECDCYCPETGRVTRKRLSHHSVRGRVLAGGA